MRDLHALDKIRLRDDELRYYGHMKREVYHLEWISVKERLPEEKTPVLVTWVGINGKIHSDAVAAIIYGKWYWWEISAEDSLEFDSKCTFVQITHWMPLPKPPKEGKDET